VESIYSTHWVEQARSTEGGGAKQKQTVECPKHTTMSFTPSQ